MPLSSRAILQFPLCRPFDRQFLLLFNFRNSMTEPSSSTLLIHSVTHHVAPPTALTVRSPIFHSEPKSNILPRTYDTPDSRSRTSLNQPVDLTSEVDEISVSNVSSFSTPKSRRNSTASDAATSSRRGSVDLATQAIGHEAIDVDVNVHPRARYNALLMQSNRSDSYSNSSLFAIANSSLSSTLAPARYSSSLSSSSPYDDPPYTQSRVSAVAPTRYPSALSSSSPYDDTAHTSSRASAGMQVEDDEVIELSPQHRSQRPSRLLPASTRASESSVSIPSSSVSASNSSSNSVSALTNPASAHSLLSTPSLAAMFTPSLVPFLLGLQAELNAAEALINIRHKELNAFHSNAEIEMVPACLVQALQCNLPAFSIEMQLSTSSSSFLSTLSLTCFTHALDAMSRSQAEPHLSMAQIASSTLLLCASSLLLVPSSQLGSAMTSQSTRRR